MRIVEAKQSRFKLIYIRFKRFTFVNQDRSSRQSSSVCKTRYIAIVRARIKTEWINQRRPPPPIQRGMMNESIVYLISVLLRRVDTVLNGRFLLKWRTGGILVDTCSQATEAGIHPIIGSDKLDTNFRNDIFKIKRALINDVVA